MWVGSQCTKCTQKVAKTFQVLSLQLEAGKTTLVLPQPPAQLGIPVTMLVFDHLLSARSSYVLPPEYNLLMNSICYVDSDTFFISYISKLLVLPRNELTYTTMFDTFQETIRDRYHQVVSHETLRPPPSINLCIKCFKLVERKVDKQVHCCMCYIHKDCVADELQCPYCGKCWLLMSCRF